MPKKKRNPAVGIGWARGLVSLARLSGSQFSSAANNAQPTRIYVSRHCDDQGQLFWSVNLFDGEGGTQSTPFYNRTDAVKEARRLAHELGVQIEDES